METTGIVLAAALVIGATSGEARAEDLLFDFSTDQYTSSFRETFNPANIGYSPSAKNLTYSHPASGPAYMDQQAGTIIYDTAPATATNDNGMFLSETISTQVSFDVIGGTTSPNAGIFARIQSDNTGVLALLSVSVIGESWTTTSTSNFISIRLFYGADATSAALGTAFYTGGFDLRNGGVDGSGTGSSNALARNSLITLSLTQSTDVDPVFSFTVSDGDGFMATSGAVALTATNAYDNPGSIGFRVSAAASSDSITLDNIAIVPEPTAAMLVGIVGGAAFGLMRPKAPGGNRHSAKRVNPIGQ